MSEIDYVEAAKSGLRRACNKGTIPIQIPKRLYPITFDDIVCCSNCAFDHDKSKWRVELAIPKLDPDIHYILTNVGCDWPELYSITIDRIKYPGGY